MPIKLIIFDLDGTLVDSSVDIANALNHALEPHGKRLSVEDTIRIVGEGITRLIERVVGNAADASTRSEVTKRFLEYYSSHIVEFTREYPGVRETLERLVDYKKAVISNKKEYLSKDLLERLGLLKHFDIVAGSDSAPEKKPSPVPILKVLSELRVEPPEALIVGDSNFDVDAGKAAGITTVAVTYGYKPVEAIRHADYLIDRMIDLIPLLEKLKG